MSLVEDFENCYVELRDLIEKGKEFFGESIQYSIVMKADKLENQFDRPKLQATIKSRSFSDWEGFAYWLDNEEGEMYSIEIYQDGLVIEQDLE